jgi:hypothetical protein
MSYTGYRPPSSMKRMMSSDVPEKTDEEEDLEEEALRSFIKEEIKGIHFYGFSKGSVNDVKKDWPVLYTYLCKKYGDFLPGCVVAIQRANKISIPTPYILLPDTNLSVLTWNRQNKCPAYSQSEDLARFLEKFK